ncbi:hypothetical protein SAMN05428975_0420 [Mucilaginibacter sp. OK268]|jgi:hypothetical protein|uniref:DUF6236 family protein n=1 Tax=Mucilaginibacter sp. OK268 TaxID=1881048 RepID=UPI00088A275B|nr:DUF6236 family protein [Mucilaginibacter sp. OK268]SDP13114.1 hypothetical protein SAMN05428975_0420 [Mucilaginibacter sp. OK268]
MERTLLYYPTIDIPAADWLASGLLYADSVSSILPFYGIEDPRIPANLLFLIDSGQYKPVFIERVLGRYMADFREFQDLFIATTSSAEFISKNNKKKEIQGAHFELLYGQKMTGEIRWHLQERGFIFKQGNGNVLVDELVALYYMGLLAQYVAKVEKNDLIIPSTDDKRYEEIAFGMGAHKAPVFNLILEKVLPVPVAGTDIKAIIKFKKNYEGELIEFRKFISRIQDKIRNAGTPEEAKEILIETAEAIKKGTADIEKIYKDGGIKTFFSSFESLFKVESPKMFQTLMAAGVISAPINPIAGAITGLIGITGGVASSYFNNKKEADKSEFSYLFKAKKQQFI